MSTSPAKTPANPPLLTITGTLLARNRPVELPELPSGVSYSPATGASPLPALAVNLPIAAKDLLQAIQFANKLFDAFELTGPTEAQASAVLLTRALGAGHKVAEHPAFGKEAHLLDGQRLTELAYAAQDAGIVHRLEPEIQGLTDGEQLCEQQSAAIKLEAKGLGLAVQESLSRTTVSRYLTISDDLGGSGGTTGAAPLQVRISDHGGNTGSACMAIGLRDDLAPVFARMREQFGLPAGDRPSPTERLTRMPNTNTTPSPGPTRAAIDTFMEQFATAVNADPEASRFVSVEQRAPGRWLVENKYLDDTELLIAPVFGTSSPAHAVLRVTEDDYAMLETKVALPLTMEKLQPFLSCMGLEGELAGVEKAMAHGIPAIELSPNAVLASFALPPLPVLATNAKELEALLAPMGADSSVRKRYEDGDCLSLAVVLAVSLPKGEAELVYNRQAGDNCYHFAVKAFGETWDVAGKDADKTYGARYREAYPDDKRRWTGWKVAELQDFDRKNRKSFTVDRNGLDLPLRELSAAKQGRVCADAEVKAVKQQLLAAKDTQAAFMPVNRGNYAPIPEKELARWLATHDGLPIAKAFAESKAKEFHAEPEFEIRNGTPGDKSGVNLLVTKLGEYQDSWPLSGGSLAASIDLANKSINLSKEKNLTIPEAAEHLQTRAKVESIAENLGYNFHNRDGRLSMTNFPVPGSEEVSTLSLLPARDGKGWDWQCEFGANEDQGRAATIELAVKAALACEQNLVAEHQGIGARVEREKLVPAGFELTKAYEDSLQMERRDYTQQVFISQRADALVVRAFRDDRPAERFEARTTSLESAVKAGVLALDTWDKARTAHPERFMPMGGKLAVDASTPEKAVKALAALPAVKVADKGR